MEMVGRQATVSARGATEGDAMRAAITGACARIADGRTAEHPLSGHAAALGALRVGRPSGISSRFPSGARTNARTGPLERMAAASR